MLTASHAAPGIFAGRLHLILDTCWHGWQIGGSITAATRAKRAAEGPTGHAPHRSGTGNGPDCTDPRRCRNTAPPSPGKPGGKLPLNTNGGGLSYMHSGMYGMYALQESVRQLRGTAAAQVPGAKTSVSHGVGGMFGASGTVIFGNEAR